MARTVDLAAHTVRRDAYLDTAQRLIQLSGYEQMSVQSVLDEMNTSKGAFYHYFDSKGALLDGVIERMVEGAMAAVEPIVADPETSAVEKLRGVSAGIAAFKATQKALILSLIEVWLSDDNAIVREKFRRSVATRLTPLFASIVRQGVAEGVFTPTSPDDAAHVLVALVLGMNQTATELFIGHEAKKITRDEVLGALSGFAEAFDRILGAPEGSVLIVDEAVLDEWFVDQEGKADA